MKPILIAEDERRVAAFLEKGLSKNGFATIVAEDGQQAINLAIQSEFELLLLDLGLPVKDGFTVLNELRSQNTALPIIVITAFDDEQSLHRVLSQGANDYLKKPFSFKDLLAKISCCL